MAVGLAAARVCEPLAVALAESVMVLAEVLTDRIVVPDGMPVPVMLSPAARPRSILTDARDGRRSARQCAGKDECLVRAGQDGHARVGVDVAQRHVEVGDGDVR